VRKRLLIAAAIVMAVLVAAGASLLVRQSALSALVRSTAEARLSAALGQPVSIGDIGFSLFPRPAFTGSAISLGGGEREAPSIQLDRVRVVPRIRSFFSDVVRIEEVRLDGFTISLLRDAEGGWHAPAVFGAPSGEGGGVAIERVRIFDARVRIFDGTAGGPARQTSSIDAIRADLAIDAARVRLAPLEGRIGDAPISGEAVADATSIRLTFEAPSIADGDLPALFGLLGAARPSVVRLDRAAAASVSVSIDRSTARLSGKGTIAMPALTVEPLRLERLEAPFTIAGSRLTFTPTTFVLNQGTHGGRLTLALDRDPPRWTSDSRLEGIDVGALLDALAGRDAKIDGRGRLDARMAGRIEPDFVAGLDGRADVALADGVIHDFPLVATVNRALGLAESEGRDTRFERLAATLAIVRGVATTDDLRIDAGHLRFEAAGRIGFEGALDLRGRAIVARERVAEAVASVHELARLKNSRGEIALPLTIAGTVDAPRFGVDVGAAIKEGVRDELLRRLRGIIRK
jgi:uncharacterized protein involved in outer membrane biogenesis